MGLDMYLYKITKKADKRYKVGYREIKDVLCYWRKANQIRGWLVDNGVIEANDNCKQRPIDHKTIGKLVDDCNRIVKLYDTLKAAHHNDDPCNTEAFKKYIECKMPPTQGFFFGSCKVDDFYVKDIRYTADKLKNVLETTTDYDKIYYSDWW